MYKMRLTKFLWNRFKKKMKKQQLRKIIRESIKQLVKEQSGQYTKCRIVRCSFGAYTWKYMKVDGATPQAGDVFDRNGTKWTAYICWSNDTSNNGEDFTRESAPCPACGHYSQGNPPAGGVYHTFPPFTCNYTSSTPCDTSPSTACAQQWFQNPNAGWASTWINSKDCTNYTWPSIHLVQDAIDIMALAPNPQTGPYNGFQDIWDAGNNSGLVSPQKEQFIAKMAKGMFAQCQIQNCC
jgi:hypothetical protein